MGRNIFDDENEDIMSAEEADNIINGKINVSRDIEEYGNNEEDYNEETYNEDGYVQEEEVSYSRPPLPQKVVYNLNKQEHSIMDEAFIRLEQARLYELLSKSDIFDGVQANPKALNNVKRELKDFIMERLQILLGITQPKSTIQPEDIKFELPFSEDEVEYLKFLAKKGMAVAQHKPEEINMLSPISEKKLTISATINQPTQQSSQQLRGLGQKKSFQTRNTDEKSIIKKEVKNIQMEQKIKPKQNTVQQERVVEKPLQNTTLEAKRQLEKEQNIKKPNKPIHKMSRKELMEYNKELDKTRKKYNRSTNVYQPPSSEQLIQKFLGVNQGNVSTEDSMSRAIMSKISLNKGGPLIEVIDD